MEGDHEWGAPPPPKPRRSDHGGGRGLLARAAANAAGSPGGLQPANAARVRGATAAPCPRRVSSTPGRALPCPTSRPSCPTAGVGDAAPPPPRDPALSLPLPWSDYFDAQQEVHCPERGATFHVYTAGAVWAASRGACTVHGAMHDRRHSTEACAPLAAAIAGRLRAIAQSASTVHCKRWKSDPAAVWRTLRPAAAPQPYVTQVVHPCLGTAPLTCPAYLTLVPLLPGSSGPVVLCLHGGGYTGLSWALIARRLKDK